MKKLSYKALLLCFLNYLNSTFIKISYFKKISKYWSPMNAKTSEFLQFISFNPLSPSVQDQIIFSLQDRLPKRKYFDL